MSKYNGVGAYWMPEKLRSSITLWFTQSFSESLAEDHDLAYWLGEYPRLLIDWMFLQEMLYEAKLEDSLRLKVGKTFKALVIYLVVLMFGWKSYNRIKE